MRQQIDLRFLQPSVTSPLTLAEAAAVSEQELCSCKTNEREKQYLALPKTKQKELPTLFCFSALALPASGKADCKTVTETSLTAFYVNHSF